MMNTGKVNKWLVPALFFAIVAGCTKNKKELPQQGETSLAAIAGTYQITAAKADGIDVYNNVDASKNRFQPCEKDNFHRFQDDGIYQIVDVGETCNPSVTGESRWSLIDNRQMKYKGAIVNIQYVDSKKMVLTHQDNTYIIEITFTKY